VESGHTQAGAHRVVDAMEILLMTEGGEAVRRQAFRGRGFYSNLRGAW
jgi:hypothetical protein